MIINELIYTRYDACAAGQLPPHCTDGKTEVPVDWLKTLNPSCTSEPLGSSEGSLHTWTPGIKLRDRERPEIAFSIKQPISIFNDFFCNLSCGKFQICPTDSAQSALWGLLLANKKHRHHFANRVLYSQSYGFSSSHVWVWDLDHKQGWVPKNWFFQTVVVEKTLKSPLDSKDLKPVNPKRN